MAASASPTRAGSLSVGALLFLGGALACQAPREQLEPSAAPAAPVDVRSAAAQGLYGRLSAELPARMASADLPGLAVAVVDRQGSAWIEGFGRRARGSTEPVGPATLFSMQSISKSLTSTGVLLSVQRGAFSLDEPLAGLLPDWQLQSRFAERPEERITLRHLLSHRAGLAHEAPVGNNFDARSPSFEAHVESIRATWQRYPVGQRFSYSNLGLDLAGFLIQRAWEQPFASWMEAEVLRPLGMRHATYSAEQLFATNDRASGHDALVPDLPQAIPMVAAGNLWASAEDLAAYVRFHLAGGRVEGEPFLDPTWLEEMARIPFAEGQVDGYGLGIARRMRDGANLLQHGAGGFGFLADIRWYPAHGFGTVVLTNSIDQNLVWELAEELGRELRRGAGLLAAEPPGPTELPGSPPFEPDAHERRLLQGLAGTYLNDEDRVEVRWAAGRASLRFGENPAVPLHFESVERAYVQAGAERVALRFLLHADGRPWSILRLRDGMSADYNTGPGLGPGPDRQRWSAFEGSYRQHVHGTPQPPLRVHRRNGWLFLDELRLDEHEPGLFFTSTGRTLDLRAEPPTYRSGVLERLPHEHDPVAGD